MWWAVLFSNRKNSKRILCTRMTHNARSPTYLFVSSMERETSPGPSPSRSDMALRPRSEVSRSVFFSEAAIQNHGLYDSGLFELYIEAQTCRQAFRHLSLGKE